jgi:DNA-binding SARP family transcriptional activator
LNDLRFRILGPLEVVVDGRPVELGGTKQRAVLAALVLRANTVVSTAGLIDLVWNDDPPQNARAALHVYLSRLRRVLAPAGTAAPLVTHTNGYMLVVAPGQLDADDFEKLVRDGREALAEHAGTADALLTRALTLWRGPALADLADDPSLRADISRLNDARVRALEDRVEARLLLGRAEDTVPELQQLVEAHPYRERLRAQLMRSLWACGRQADALEAFQDARNVLKGELGLEPGEELRQLQRAILTQAESPLPEPRDDRLPAVPGRHRRRTPVTAVAAVAAAAAVAGALVYSQREEGTGGRPATALVSLEPVDLRATGSIDVAGVSAMVVSGQQAWLAQNRERLVVRVDLSQRRVVERVGLPIRPDALAVSDEVWAAAAGDAELGRVANAAITRVREGANGRPAVSYIPGSGGGTVVIAADATTLWVGNDDDDRIARFDTAERRVSATVRTVTPRVLVVGRDVVWAVEPLDDVVTRIDATSGSITGSVGVELEAPSAGLEAAGALWITDRAAGLLWRIDAAGHVATRTIEVGRGPIAIAYGGGFLWVANVFDGTISKIDPSENQVVATEGVDGHPIALGWSRGSLWVLTRTTIS